MTDALLLAIFEWTLIISLGGSLGFLAFHVPTLLFDYIAIRNIEKKMIGRYIDSGMVAKQTCWSANTEHNDCTVLARMVAFDMSYSDAHKYLEVNFGRKERDGVPTLLYYETLRCLYKRGDVVNGKYFTSAIDDPKRANGTQMMVKDYLEKDGTYILSINGHTLCVKDGVLFDSTTKTFSYNAVVFLENKVENFDESLQLSN